MSVSNEAEIYAFLKGKGLTPAQIAGVLGNFKIESGFSPTANNPGEGAIGIAQWEGGRRTALQHYASAHGGSERSLPIQLGFMWHELTGSESGALRALRGAHTPAAAAAAWDANYERSDGSARGARIGAAQSISHAIASGSLTAGGGSSKGGSSKGGSSKGGDFKHGGSKGGSGGGSRQRLVVHPAELADVAKQVAAEADRTQYIVRGMTRHIGEMDALVSGGAFVVPDPARFSLARRGLEEALTGKNGVQVAALGLSDVAAWVEKFRQQILGADGPAAGLGGWAATPPKKHPHPRGHSPVGHHGSSRSAKVDKMLAFAKKEHANDGGNNHTKYGAWFGNNGAPWCAQFVSFVFAHSGNKLPNVDGSKGFQSVQSGLNYARAHHQLFSRPRAGDIFLATDGHHTGIVSKVYPDGHFDTVEGNAGSNTDRVVHGSRWPRGFVFWTAIRP